MAWRNVLCDRFLALYSFAEGGDGHNLRITAMQIRRSKLYSKQAASRNGKGEKSLRSLLG